MDNFTRKPIQFESNTYDEKVTLFGDVFEPTEEVKGIVEIVHGMAEHRKRYEGFAGFLAANGYITVIYDQRGHGETCGSVKAQGYMSDVDNFDAMVQDANLVNQEIKKMYPDKKFVLMGHSMGSFITQRYLELYPDSIDAAILSGTNFTKSLLYKLGAVIAKGEVKKHGRKYISKKLINLSFGSYNKAFKPNRTDYDWLSVNEANVDKYIADPYCGADFTASYFMDLIINFNTIAKDFNKIPKSMPVYLFSGAKDPVGNMGKGVKKLFNTYKKLGLEKAEMKLYENGRHEMLNETNKEEVYQDVLNWLNQQ